ncbi:MAG: hypothetical protein U0973_13680 [Xanthomonadaceae bacterium]|nr:hypothetical protein [Xanthomonadaceae bacterium]
MPYSDAGHRGLLVGIGLWLIVPTALWLLWPGVHGPFLFDDFPNLQNLREVGDHFTRESIGRYLAAWQGNPGRPLAALSFLIEDHAWPSDPEAFKRNNLLWHLLVGLGIFALTRRLVRLALANRAPTVGAGHARDQDAHANHASAIAEDGGHAPVRAGHARDRFAGTNQSFASPDDGGRGNGPLLQGPAENEPAPLAQHSNTTLPDWIALAVLALWLVHPFQLSATFLVVQRMTILANGLIVAGLLIYLRLVSGSNPGFRLRLKPGYERGHAAAGWREAIAALAALGGFGALAFLAKENGPLIFAYATALNLTLLAPALARFDTGPRRLLWAGTLGMTLLLIAALLWQVRDPAAAYAGRDFSLAERVLSQARILWEYLHTIVLPKLGGGGIYHDDFVVSHGLLQPWTTLPAVLGIVAALGLALFGRRRFPLVAFAVLWFTAGHLIESTVIPLELYFEHRNYLAMLGPLLALCVWLAYPGGDLKWPLRILLVVWIALVAGIGHHAARQWSDGLTLAAVWERERPQSARAAQFLASEFVRQDDYLAARNVLLNARDRLPSAGEFNFQLALLDCRYGQADDNTFESLIAHAHRSNWSRIVPEIVMSLRGYMGNDRCGKALPPERFLRLIQALLKNPEYAGRPDAVAHLHYELARMYLDTDQPHAALAHFEASYLARPDPQVAINLAQVALYLGDADEASLWISAVEATPRPWFKSWLDPKTVKIDQLRNTAEAVRAVQGRPQ